MPSRVSRKKCQWYRLSVIECFCRAQILLVPNRQNDECGDRSSYPYHTLKKDANEAQAEAERIRDDLITKVLEMASEL